MDSEDFEKVCSKHDKKSIHKANYFRVSREKKSRTIDSNVRCMTWDKITVTHFSFRVKKNF